MQTKEKKSLSLDEYIVMQDLKGIVKYLRDQSITGGQAQEIFQEQADQYEPIVEEMYEIKKDSYKALVEAVKKTI
ncbi:hypothetical protein OCD65_28005 [Bacillus paranthracis]|uniref:hypothetical protein n=1 Tax=Bacillus cereus group TaxID=86661 RepID=UPI001F56D434|nr:MULTISPECIES: hypothetical protein [Bacillus cereus group]MCU5020526.1 hypothetical protein [Bacillus paranthracis]